MKMATKIVLLSLFAVVAASFTSTLEAPLETTVTDPASLREATTKAATATNRTIVPGTHDDIIIRRFSTTHSTTTSITTTPHKIPEPTPTTSKSTSTTSNTIHTTMPATTTIATTTSHITTARATILITTTPLITTTTTTTTIRSPNFPIDPACQNGGYFDGYKCICRELFYGPLCENIVDEVQLGQTFLSDVNVVLRISNLEFSESLTDSESEEYWKFTSDFKEKMSSVYSKVPAYIDVTILNIRKGSVIVDHNVIVGIEYKAGAAQEYHQIVLKVEEQINSVECTAGNLEPWCFDGGFITPIPLPSEAEMCRRNVLEGFADFYDPLLTENGLVCISHCDTGSLNHLNCNEGKCKLEYGTGPRCLCPNTDSYIYTSQQCTGKISKIGLYVGVGVGIGILILLLVILGISLWKIKNKAPKILNEEETYYSTIKR